MIEKYVRVFQFPDEINPRFALRAESVASINLRRNWVPLYARIFSIFKNLPWAPSKAIPVVPNSHDCNKIFGKYDIR